MDIGQKDGQSPSKSKNQLGVVFTELSDEEVYSEMVELLATDNILVITIPRLNPSDEIVDRVVEKLHQFTNKVGGDIVQFGTDKLIATPSEVRISRDRLGE